MFEHKIYLLFLLLIPFLILFFVLIYFKKKNNIYKFVDGKEIINWNRLMIFTVFDIINSPYKDAMVKEAKFIIGRYEAFNKSKENQNINVFSNNIIGRSQIRRKNFFGFQEGINDCFGN